MEDLLLTRDDLDDIENSPIFSLWLFGDVDESQLTEREKQIIVARQMYYDLSMDDDIIRYALNWLDCVDYEEVLNNPKLINELASNLKVRKDYITTKLTLMQKRRAKEQKLELNREK